MIEITVISGKGGTGKTSVTAALAELACQDGEALILADTDVDAANLHLVLNPSRTETEEFVCGFQARIDPSLCTQCGACLLVCRFGALTESEEMSGAPRITTRKCEGCGACADRCPHNAITLHDKTAGEIYRSETRLGPFIHARLGFAQSTSGKLVSRVRAIAKERAEREKSGLILVDGPPGIGCPVIAAVGGADAAVIVTEPTVSARHDLCRVLDLCEHFKVRTGVIINRCDLNVEEERAINKEVDRRGARLLGRLPFDPLFVRAVLEGRTVIDYAPESEPAQALREIWRELKDWIRHAD